MSFRQNVRKSSRAVAAFLGGAIAATLLLPAAAGAQTVVTDGSLVIRDFVLARGVHDREPVGVTNKFDRADSRAYAHVRIDNAGAPTQVTVVWENERGETARVPLKIGTSPAWRTWSSVNLGPGDWRVKLVTQSGLVLAENKFRVGTSIAGDEMDWDDIDAATDDIVPAAGTSNDDFDG